MSIGNDALLGRAQDARQFIDVNLVLVAYKQGQHNEMGERLFCAERGSCAGLASIRISKTMAYIILDLLCDAGQFYTFHLPLP